MSRVKAIVLRDVTTIYEGERFPAIRDVDLEVDFGEFLCVVGPNGAGKTTLLETINGLLEADGLRLVLGFDVSRFKGRVRCEVGYVPQDFMVDPLTPYLVRDVVLMGRFGKVGLLRSPTREDLEKVWEAMKVVGVEHLANRPVGKLSGGQQQKVMIARALAKEPKILLLDEPLNHVDLNSRTEIMESLRVLHEKDGLTILMVIHSLGEIPNWCKRVVLMNGGRIVCDGPPSEVFNSEAFRRIYKTLHGGVFVDSSPLIHPS